MAYRKTLNEIEKRLFSPNSLKLNETRLFISLKVGQNPSKNRPFRIRSNPQNQIFGDSFRIRPQQNRRAPLWIGGRRHSACDRQAPFWIGGRRHSVFRNPSLSLRAFSSSRLGFVMDIPQPLLQPPPAAPGSSIARLGPPSESESANLQD